MERKFDKRPCNADDCDRWEDPSQYEICKKCIDTKYTFETNGLQIQEELITIDKQLILRIIDCLESIEFSHENCGAYYCPSCGESEPPRNRQRQYKYEPHNKDCELNNILKELKNMIGQ